MKTHRPPHIHPDTSIMFITGRCYSGISWLYSDDTKKHFYNKLLETTSRYKLELDAWVICNNHYHLLLRATDGKQVPKFVKHLHGATAHHIKQQMPPIVIGGDQVLTREITPWDKRQTARLKREAELLERRLKSANAEQEESISAQFIARHQVDLIKKVLADFSPRQKRELKFAITDPRILTLLIAKDAPIWYQYMDHVIRNDEDYYKHLNYIHQNPVKHGYTKKLTDYRWSSIHKWIDGKGKEFVADCFRTYPIIDFEPIAE